ncbi:cysteine desulfurase family protein [Maritalea mediterranea]|uniref:Cysteine desulfurase n=1 Tax=Maritalea mediterranea TaxID=2909667 RepID=A0ABS9EAB7_9HYPH|nr:aminotransferase class V-fold PLP-dependent enzyme [Maritalea mediterranea]MCF4099831.1 aminotransferase class V-fold PLP-dependent enzyme [Maritalea mediterranea]
MTQHAVTYLDHSASAPLLPDALAAMNDTLAIPGNPSSVHENGRKLRAIIEEARDHVALLCGTARGRVVFTGSATESLTHAIWGLARSGKINRILVGAGEHMAVIRAVETAGVPFDLIPLQSKGLLDLVALERQLEAAAEADERVLVAVQQVNNETSVVQPIDEIGNLMFESEHYLLVDGAQGAGKVEFYFDPSRADFYSVSAHKIGGPAGVGALILKPRVDDVRLIPGGGQEQGRRGGTESAALLSGFGVAAAQAVEDFANMPKDLVAAAEAGLKKLYPQVEFFGADAPRSGFASAFALPGIKNNISMIQYDLAHIALSAGSACSSGKVSRSHVLAAMQVDPELADCALRLSVGWNSTMADIEQFLSATKQIVEKFRGEDQASA